MGEKTKKLSVEQQAMAKALWRKAATDENGVDILRSTKNECIALRLALYTARKAWKTSEPALWEATDGLAIRYLKDKRGEVSGLHIGKRLDPFAGLAGLLGDSNAPLEAERIAKEREEAGTAALLSELDAAEAKLFKALEGIGENNETFKY